MRLVVLLLLLLVGCVPQGSSGPPREGDPGGRCYPNGTCNDGATCDRNRCETTPRGTPGGACYPNGTCNEGAACVEQRCEGLPDAALPDAGVVPDAMPEPDAAPRGPYPWVVVVDRSPFENEAGRPGADVCGASARCEDGPFVAREAVFGVGEGGICPNAPPEECLDGTARDDANAALDDGFRCDDAQAGTSDYVSLGMTGTLALNFGRDLRGCVVNVVEHVGELTEAYEVYLCETQDVGGECLAPVTALDGGELSFDVP